MAHDMHVITSKARRVSATEAKPVTKTPYGLQVIETCLKCPMTKEQLFCNLPAQTIAALDEISSSATYPKGAILFVEGQDPRGVFILCHGRVKLSASSASGKSMILRFAKPGEVVGLPGTLLGRPYEDTAEAIEPIQANFIPRAEFLQFLRAHGDAALRVAEMLCHIYYATYQEVKYLGLSGSATDKLAHFLLDRVDSQGPANGNQHATLVLTHEEIAGLIGVSRETVTRLFTTFKQKELIEVRGSTIVIKNRRGLEEFASGERISPRRHGLPEGGRGLNGEGQQVNKPVT